MNAFRKLTKDEIDAAQYQSSVAEGEDDVVPIGGTVIVFDGRIKPKYTATIEGVYYRDDEKATAFPRLMRYSYEIRMPDGRTRRINASRVSTPEGRLMTKYKAELEKEKRLHDAAVKSAKLGKVVILGRDP